jgi:hypothetical protein
MKADALADAERLGLTTAEYGRMAFARLLGDRVSVDTAAGYKTPPTKKELRERARANGHAASIVVTGPNPSGRTLAPLARTEVEPHPKATARRKR